MKPDQTRALHQQAESVVEIVESEDLARAADGNDVGRFAGLRERDPFQVCRRVPIGEQEDLGAGMVFPQVLGRPCDGGDDVVCTDAFEPGFVQSPREVRARVGSGVRQELERDPRLAEMTERADRPVQRLP